MEPNACHAEEERGGKREKVERRREEVSRVCSMCDEIAGGDHSGERQRQRDRDRDSDRDSDRDRDRDRDKDSDRARDRDRDRGNVAKRTRNAVCQRCLSSATVANLDHGPLILLLILLRSIPVEHSYEWDL